MLPSPMLQWVPPTVADSLSFLPGTHARRCPEPLAPESPALLQGPSRPCPLGWLRFCCWETEPWRLAALTQPDSLEAHHLCGVWCEARPRFAQLLACREPGAVTVGGRWAELPRGRGVDMISRLLGGCPVDSQLLTYEATVGCSGPPSEPTKSWGEGRGHWYQKEGNGEAHGLIDDLGDPSPQTSQTPIRGACRLLLLRRDALAGQSLPEEGVSLRGPGRFLRGKASWRRSLCVVDSPCPPAQQYVCAQTSASRT